MGNCVKEGEEEVDWGLICNEGFIEVGDTELVVGAFGWHASEVPVVSRLPERSHARFPAAWLRYISDIADVLRSLHRNRNRKLTAELHSP